MALDCYLKDADGLRIYHYPINDSLHKEIFSNINKTIRFPTLNKLNDYYKDSRIAESEIPSFMDELKNLKPYLSNEIQTKIEELIDMISDNRVNRIECFCD